jgi:hypothetical protein
MNVSGGGNLSREVNLGNVRAGTSFSPWGICGGDPSQSKWDYNDANAPFVSGTISSTARNGTTITVTDTSKSWSTNQWVVEGDPYSVVNMSITDASGFHPAAVITSNNSNTLTSVNYDWWSRSSEPNWSNGNSYQIVRAHVCIDQTGRGGNGATYLSGNPPTQRGWVNQPLDPVYQWGSTVSGASISQWVQSNWNVIQIKNNQDYYYKSSSFNGSSGTGAGTLANRPSTCTPYVAYWVTDQGGNWNTTNEDANDGTLYICTAENTWTQSYTPYMYPHPLTLSITPPTNLRFVP